MDCSKLGALPPGRFLSWSLAKKRKVDTESWFYSQYIQDPRFDEGGPFQLVPPMKPSQPTKHLHTYHVCLTVDLRVKNWGAESERLALRPLRPRVPFPSPLPLPFLQTAATLVNFHAGHKAVPTARLTSRNSLS